MRTSGTAGGLALGLVVGFNVANIGAVATEIAGAYAIALATVGLLTTVVFVVHLGMQLPAGRASDRFGPRRIGLVGLLVLAAVNGVAMIDNEVWLAFAARTLIGVGLGLGFVAGIEYIRETTRSAVWQGVFGGMTGIGASLALLIVPQVEKAAGFRAPFLAAGALALAGAAVLALGPGDQPRTPAVADWTEERRRGVIGDRRLLRLALLTAGPSGFALVIGNWIAALLVEAGGHSPGTAGAVGALTLIGGIVTRPISGWILHHRAASMRTAIAASVALGTAGTLAVAKADALWLVIPGALAVGLASGLPWAYGFTAAAWARPDAPGPAVALVNMSGLVVIIAGVPLVGLTFSLPGHGRIGFAAIAACWALSILTLPSGREVLAMRARADTP